MFDQIATTAEATTRQLLEEPDRQFLLDIYPSVRRIKIFRNGSADRVSWRAPEMTFEPRGNDWYFTGSLKEWHGARERGEIIPLVELKEWEAKVGLTPDYETEKTVET